MSVVIQKMCRSDIGSAGVSFSIDTESGFENAVIINSSYGLGEIVVSGAILPDEFIVFKPTLKQNKNAIVEKKLGEKNEKIIYGKNPDEKVRKVTTSKKERNTFSLSEENIIKLANDIKIEEYYSKLKNSKVSVDVEWALDGIDQKLYIVQAREETTISKK